MLSAAASRGRSLVSSSVLRRRKIPATRSRRLLWPQKRLEACGLLSDRLRDGPSQEDASNDMNHELQTKSVAALYPDYQSTQRKDILGGRMFRPTTRSQPLWRNESLFGSTSIAWPHQQQTKQLVSPTNREWPSTGQQWESATHRHNIALSSHVPSTTLAITTIRPNLVRFQQQVSFFSTSSQQGSSNSPTEEHKPKKAVNPSRILSRSKIPTPKSAPPVNDNPLASLPEPKSVARKGMDLIIYLSQTVLKFLYKLPGNLYFYATNPTERKAYMTEIQDMIKHEVNHYWMGTKLLWADIRTARDLLNKTLRGNPLTRRERRQLLRTVSDLFRIIPFSMFIILPFMEFALPFALRIFPNLLPSTFQDSLKAEENMKREVQSRIAMAQFFQETLEELAKEQERKASRKREELIEAGVELEEDGKDTIDKKADSAASMLEFLEKARNGEMIPPDVIIRYANYFQDDLTLDNMPRMQLINMCKYMAISPYGSDAFLRFQLRHKIRVLKEDDQRILWEGIDSLTKMELREACQERGMRSTGLSKDAYKTMLEQWLDLSVNKNVPISLLIMSRTFFLSEEVFQRKTGDSEEAAEGDLTGLVDTISGLDKEVLNEVILEVATSEEKKSDPTIRKLKLEVVAQQNELIREEQEARDAAAAAAAKKKEEAAAAEKEDVQAETEAVVDETAASAPEMAAKPLVEEKIAEVSEEARAVAAEEDAQVSKKEEKAEEDDEHDLSTQEMDALENFLTDDPVSKERKELEKLKATIKGEEKEEREAIEEEAEASMVAPEDAAAKTLDTSADEPPIAAAETVSEEKQDLKPKDEAAPVVPEEEKEPVSDPVVERLQKRIESMVDKIEDQLSDVEVKIGDKLHLLDKDRDGILSQEEVAGVLQQVFKRKVSFEEAMEIVEEMNIDRNQDGIFTVDELLEWIKENKLVRFVEEGRELEMDKMMEEPDATGTKEEQADGPPTPK